MHDITAISQFFVRVGSHVMSTQRLQRPGIGSTAVKRRIAIGIDRHLSVPPQEKEGPPSLHAVKATSGKWESEEGYAGQARTEMTGNFHPTKWWQQTIMQCMQLPVPTVNAPAERSVDQHVTLLGSQKLSCRLCTRKAS